MDAPKADSPAMELWGGIECTHNRVGDRYFDQVAWTGHDRRPSDLNQFANLGLRTLRYPALWEWASPTFGKQFDWSWADNRLPRLRQLGIRPIIGFVHHGSGPAHTNLIDPAFANELAHYAGAFARRFPDVLDYTPVNEPLTTARFGTLYGHWYPHLRDDRALAVAMLNQCRAIALAMRAIREVQPAARLIQTEDLGRTYSTRPLAYQADFDNARRWLTLDLLCGRVNCNHPIGSYFLWLGIAERELLWFQNNICPPDIIGINYYVTSERFLDHRLDHYPPHLHGGNGRHRYADVEAVRVRSEGIAGVEAILSEAHDRYCLPLAITEAHLACSREEQVRWFREIWDGAIRARQAGADVRAVTAWSLLGAFDWDSLVTKPRGHYEPGAFDIRGGIPRPTALARLIADLASSNERQHPVLAQSGWWRRPERLHFHPHVNGHNGHEHAMLSGQPLLITGARGTLGAAFARICRQRALPYRLLHRQEMDIADHDSVARCLEKIQPWAIVNAAGYARIDEAEQDAERCWRENVAGPEVLAGECCQRDIPLVTFSSDLVFDGARRAPYRETDAVNPLNIYGRTKAEAERLVLSRHRGALVIRSSAFFGPWDECNFVFAVVAALARGQTFTASPTIVSPTYVPDLVQACLDLLIDGESGLWHLASAGETSWYDLARAAAIGADLDPELIESRHLKGNSAPRPLYSALSSDKAILLPSWEDALARFLVERSPCPTGGIPFASDLEQMEDSRQGVSTW